MVLKGRNIFGRLVLLFTLVPILELYILFQVARYTNWLVTISLVIATGFAGAYLAKREGRSILGRISRDLSEGKLPGEELINGLCVLIGGALLLTPGILTDITGFTLIIPVTRNLYKNYINSLFRRMIENGRVNVVFWDRHY
ncbi:MAG: FxsA family protein [Bacillota bacterium]